MDNDRVFITMKQFSDEEYDYEGAKIYTTGADKRALAKIVIDRDRGSVSYNIRMRKIGLEPLRVEDFHVLTKDNVNFDNISNFRLVGKNTFMKYINYINNPLSANYRNVVIDFE